MAKYTTEVRYICEHLCGLDESKGYSDVNTIISNARTKIFDFTYPLFEDSYRPVLESKILKHFYTREIGMETVGLWKLRLDAKLNEIMPFYNKLYEADLEGFNPFLSTDMRTERSTVGVNERKTDENIGDKNIAQNSTHNDTTSKANNRGLVDNGIVTKNQSYNLYSETPQGSLSGVNDENYLTDARKITEDNISNGHTHTLDVGESQNIGDNTTNINSVFSRDRDVKENVNSTERFLERTYGYNGYIPAEMLKKYREVVWNIDMMIIEELEPLFMQLW